MFTEPVRLFFIHLCVIIFTGIILLYGYSTTWVHDVGVYNYYAINFWHGSFGSSMLPKEYFILSLVPMLLPLITGEMYSQAYNFILLVLVFGIYLFLFYLRSKISAFVFIVYILLGSIGLVLSRLDLIIGMLILLSLFEAKHKKFISAYILLAIGTMIKIVPIFLVLPLFLEEQRFRHVKSIKRFYGLSIFIGICLFFFLLSFAMDAKNAFMPIKYAIERPIEIESVPASIIHTFNLLNIFHTCSFAGFGTLNIGMFEEGICNAPNNGSWKLIVMSVMFVFNLVLAFGLMYMVDLYRERKVNLSQMYIIVILLLLSTNKVLSPQFILWLLPVIAYVHGFDKRIFSFVAILSVLTTIVFPILPNVNTLISIQNIQVEDGALVRNLVLIVFVIAYIFNIYNIRGGRGDSRNKFKEDNK